MAKERPRQYLLRTERRVVEVRKHPFFLSKPITQTMIMLLAALIISKLGKDDELVSTFSWWVAVVAILRLGWIIGEWYVYRLIVTDKRMLLTRGLITRKIGMMDVNKVTDMTYEQTFVGQMVGYGTFLMENAGQEQAFHRLEFIPDPYELHQQISAVLFPPAVAPPDPLV